MSDGPRVVAVREIGAGFVVFFDSPVYLRGQETSYTTRPASFHIPLPDDLPEDARYWWWAESEEGQYYQGDELGAYIWGLKLVEEHKERNRAHGAPQEEKRNHG